jgi:PhoPQ-activated pathogenicity-related protein
VLLCLAALLLGSCKATALDDYVNAPDSNYKYVDTGLRLNGTGWKGYILNMTSQRWLSDADTTCSLWWHIMAVIVPDKITSDGSFVWITGGDNNGHTPKATDQDIVVTSYMATKSGIIGAALFQIPNQPCYFSGENNSHHRTEDAVIAYTWSHFINDTSKPNWLLRLPMTKAVIRAMDTVQHYASTQLSSNVSRFIIAGASKRGWTTWTVGAVQDPRVVALVPIVMDALNFVKNVHHQFRAYGGWTFAFKDYYAMGFTGSLDSPGVAAMATIVDPYAYRSRLTMPKLVINAGGDEFFLPDDTSYWWGSLAGESHFLMVKNAEHSMATGIFEVLPAAAAFGLSVLQGGSRPDFGWTIDPVDGHITVSSKTQPLAVTMQYTHTTQNKMRDFRWVTGGSTPCTGIVVKGICVRLVLWSGKGITASADGTYVASMPMPANGTGWSAFFIEMTYAGPGGLNFTMTSQVSIIPQTFPFPDCHGSGCTGTLV